MEKKTNIQDIFMPTGKFAGSFDFILDCIKDEELTINEDSYEIISICHYADAYRYIKTYFVKKKIK